MTSSRFAVETAENWQSEFLRTAIYSNSLLLVFGAIFRMSWLAQSVAGWSDFNKDQITHHQPEISWAGYLTEPDFWDRSLQNWQSEFLAVGNMAIFAVCLRQRGSPESKPVGAPHTTTTSAD